MRSVVSSFEAFAERRFTPGPLVSHNGWSVKAYEIFYRDREASASWRHEARALMYRRLDQEGGRTNHYGLGFSCIHWGRGAVFAFIDWWADENELHHHVFVRSNEASSFTDMTGRGLAACAWDLALISFERDAWVRHVLRPEVPDFKAYVGQRLEGYF